MDDFLFDLIIILLVVGVIAYFVSVRNSKRGSTSAAPSVTSQPYLNKQQLAQDIKHTQTSRVVDAVQIMDELGADKGYRHYCELVGTAMPGGGVVAPYSRRPVAYYDLRCYRIENVEGRDIETLIAQEKSIEPFWFNDGTSEAPVYIDLETFGNNCILVNATNRVEGPNSDFAKAIAGANHGATGSYGVQAARDMGPGHGMPGGFGGSGGPRPGQHNGRVTYGGYGGYGLPSDLDKFLGGALSSGHMSVYGGPRYRNSGDDVMSTMLNIGLGALVGNLTAQAQSATQQQTGPTTSFRGYRIIEDVVPLSSPIYALGEIYRNGTEVHIGRSVSESYPSSYFACKPEAEVLVALS